MALNVLIIDDDKILSNLISLKLKKWGIIPHHTLCGFKGLELIKENEYDLVLLDINMEGISGKDVLKEIRKERDKNILPVIMISSSQDDKDLVYTMGNGANDFVVKPINDAILYARIITQLEHNILSQEFAQLKEAEGIKALIVTCRHEFNNPLMIAMGTLSQIDKNYQVDAKYVERLKNALERIEKLVIKIQNLAKDGEAIVYDEYVNEVKKIKLAD